MRLPHPDPFRDIDAQPDPLRFIEALERRGRTRSQQRLRRRFLRFIPVTPGDAVLEVGCGTGVVVRDLPRWWAPRGRVVGVDRSRATVKAARLLGPRASAARPHGSARRPRRALALPRRALRRGRGHHRHAPRGRAGGRGRRDGPRGPARRAGGTSRSGLRRGGAGPSGPGVDGADPRRRRGAPLSRTLQRAPAARRSCGTRGSKTCACSPTCTRTRRSSPTARTSWSAAPRTPCASGSSTPPTAAAVAGRPHRPGGPRRVSSSRVNYYGAVGVKP